jgi:ParB family chromosome partitioning protein
MTTVSIEQVSIHPNRRPLNDQKVSELMHSIRANGLLNPITIDQNHNLIAGLHRLTACSLLGYDQIECKIIACEGADQARLAEIDENLIRNELEALERSELWLERDQILERMGLRAKSGDNQHTRRGGETVSPPPKTTLELAQETGYTERTFQVGKQIARNINPEVKRAIRGTPVAKSPSTLLKVARAGAQERQQAEAAEQAAEQAKRQNQTDEFKKQKNRAAEARNKQRDLQLNALQEVAAEKQAKQASKLPKAKKEGDTTMTTSALPEVQMGDEWILDNHLIYCGDTATEKFIELLPSNAALAIAIPSATWQHDYLIEEAEVIAVICTEGHIHDFCVRHHMPFRFEWLLGGLYVGVFSHQPILIPTKPAGFEGIEGLIAYLLSLYTKPGNFVIAPFLNHGEVLITCERMDRICFGGDPTVEQVEYAISRWQKWTGKTAKQG